LQGFYHICEKKGLNCEMKKSFLFFVLKPNQASIPNWYMWLSSPQKRDRWCTSSNALWETLVLHKSGRWSVWRWRLDVSLSSDGRSLCVCLCVCVCFPGQSYWMCLMILCNSSVLLFMLSETNQIRCLSQKHLQVPFDTKIKREGGKNDCLQTIFT